MAIVAVGTSGAGVALVQITLFTEQTLPKKTMNNSHFSRCHSSLTGLQLGGVGGSNGAGALGETRT